MPYKDDQQIGIIVSAQTTELVPKSKMQETLGLPARCPFSPNFFGWEGSPAKIDYRKKLVP